MRRRAQVPTPTRPRPSTQNKTDRKSTRLNSSHSQISYAVFCLKKKNGSSLDIGKDHALILHADSEVVTLVDSQQHAQLTGEDHASELDALSGHAPRARLLPQIQ